MTGRRELANDPRGGSADRRAGRAAEGRAAAGAGPGLAPTPRLAGIARGEFLGKPVDVIRGGGHVLGCLEAAR